MIEDHLAELYPQSFNNINPYLTVEETIQDNFQRYIDYFSNNSDIITSLGLQNKIDEIIKLLRDFYIIYDEDDLSPQTKKNIFVFTS